MTNLLIIGAHGEIARVATRLLLERTDATLTLYLRQSHRLATLVPNPRIRLVEADATDELALEAAMMGQDLVYANLADDMARQARAIVTTMKAAGLRRLIFISSMGIYDEVPSSAIAVFLTLTAIAPRSLRIRASTTPCSARPGSIMTTTLPTAQLRKVSLSPMPPVRSPAKASVI